MLSFPAVSTGVWAVLPQSAELAAAGQATRIKGAGMSKIGLLGTEPTMKEEYLKAQLVGLNPFPPFPLLCPLCLGPGAWSRTAAAAHA